MPGSAFRTEFSAFTCISTINLMQHKCYRLYENVPVARSDVCLDRVTDSSQI